MLMASTERQLELELEMWEAEKHESNEDNDDGDDVPSLTQLCLLNLAANMEFWLTDYIQKYMDHYHFRHVMGPFSLLPKELLEKLLLLLSRRNLLSRAALDLLLLPQLGHLSLAHCSKMVTANMCSLIRTRCQNLKSLNLSGIRNVSAPVLCSLLSSLSRLNSLTLSGTPSEHTVMTTVAQHCPLLKYLDVSLCTCLTPAALLTLIHPQGGGTRHLSTLKALDIGLEENEEDKVAVAAFLLLGLPRLQCIALEGTGEACELIQKRVFVPTEGLTKREAVASLEELWADRVYGGNGKEEALEEDRVTVGTDRTKYLDGSMLDDKGGTDKRIVGRGRRLSDKEKPLLLRLREVQDVSLCSLYAIGQMCPNLCSISLNLSHNHGDEEDYRRRTLLAEGLATWSGRLHHLSLPFHGALSELVPTLEVSGSSLFSLTLEGVQVDGHLTFLELMRACPKLHTLVLHLDPPRSSRDEDDDDVNIVDWNLPRLQFLRSLNLSFSMDETQSRPVLCWSELKGALWALLSGAPRLQTLFLFGVPCRLDPVFRWVLDPSSPDLIPERFMPLEHLKNVTLELSEVTAETLDRLAFACHRLRTLNLRRCWSVAISDVNRLRRKTRSRRHCLEITWT